MWSRLTARLKSCPFISVTIAFPGLSIRYSLMGAMVFVYW